MAQNHKIFVKYVRKCIKKEYIHNIIMRFINILDIKEYDSKKDGTVEEG